MGYTPEYWKENKEKILAERRKRYRDDPEYRQRALDRAQERRERLREERAKADADPHLTMPDGRVVAAYPVSAVAAQLGVSADKMKYYLRQGYTPPAIVSRPQRLYTQPQINLMRKLGDFLAENRAALRTPTTDEGAKAHAQLDALVQTIHENWES